MNVTSAISTDAGNIDVEKPITAYGSKLSLFLLGCIENKYQRVSVVDFLEATEVRNWVLEFRSRLSIFNGQLRFNIYI